MASELGKFKLSLHTDNQYLSALEPVIRYAVVGNFGTLISFSLGARDAAYFSKELAPTFSPHDLIFLSNYGANIKLMIYGEPSNPFSFKTKK
jgi:hypothetical protein